MRRRMTCALGALALGFLTGESHAQPFTPVSRTSVAPVPVINFDNRDTGAQILPTTTTTTTPKTTIIELDNLGKGTGNTPAQPTFTPTTPKATGTNNNDTGINIPQVRSITTSPIPMPLPPTPLSSAPLPGAPLPNAGTGDGKAPKVEPLGPPTIIQGPSEGYIPVPASQNQERNCKWHWEVGGGTYYVQPFFHTNPAFLRTTGSFFSSATQQSDFRYNMQAAPIGFISYVSDSGLGIRGRYFQYDQGARENFTGDGSSKITSVPVSSPIFSVTGGAPGDVLTFNSRLRVETWDLEGTYTFNSCRWNFLAAAGVRYANLFQSYGAIVTSVGAALPQAVNTVGSFNGAGPTFALESKYRFGESGLAVYGTARGSVLFGSGRLTAGSTSNFGDNIVATSSFESRQSDILPIGEAEVGIEFGRSVGKIRVFAQTGFVGQVWFGGGNAAATGVGGHTFSNDTNFGFIGVAGRIGLNF
jgi:Legionella pneumophila major outer membrane protein precursor